MKRRSFPEGERNHGHVPRDDLERTYGSLTMPSVCTLFGVPSCVVTRLKRRDGNGEPGEGSGSQTMGGLSCCAQLTFS